MDNIKFLTVFLKKLQCIVLKEGKWVIFLFFMINSCYIKSRPTVSDCCPTSR